VRLFEIGRAYAMKNGEPLETRIATLGATGAARKKGIAESEREYEFADLKGDLDQIGDLAGGFNWSTAPSTSLPWANAARAGEFQLPAESGAAAKGVGTAGELARRVADPFKIRQNVFLAQLILDPFYEAYRTARAARKYRPISRFPAVERDFSLILKEGTAFSTVRQAIGALGIHEIASLEAVDLFRGKKVPVGRFSLLVRVTFQSFEGTLTEAQVNGFSARIVGALEQQLGATLRAS
jgi:phenylalanyl-tRNA synthetase beta chain